MPSPDFRFTKHGENYLIEIYVSMEESFHGFGKTIKQALDNAFKSSGKRLEEVETFLDYLDLKKKNFSPIDYKNKVVEAEQFSEKVETLPHFNTITKKACEILEENPSVLLFSKKRYFQRKRAVLAEALSLCGLSGNKIADMMRRDWTTIDWIRRGICEEDYNSAVELSGKIKEFVECQQCSK